MSQYHICDFPPPNSSRRPHAWRMSNLRNSHGEFSDPHQLARKVGCGGVAVAEAIKAVALVVHSAPVWVRVPAEARTKMDIGMAPCTEGAPMIPILDVSGRPAHDS